MAYWGIKLQSEISVITIFMHSPLLDTNIMTLIPTE